MVYHIAVVALEVDAAKRFQTVTDVTAQLSPSVLTSVIVGSNFALRLVTRSYTSMSLQTLIVDIPFVQRVRYTAC
jgi:hypothetical protein